MEKMNKKKKSDFIKKISLRPINYIIFGIGILAIIIGYFVMAKGDTNSFQTLSIAPIVLLIGYLVIIPFSILYRKKSNDKTDFTK